MKKILISFSILVIFIFIFVYLLKSPKWSGTTKDGNIKAVLYETQEGSAKVYDGELYWVGKKSEENKATITYTAYIENGKTKASSKKNSNVKDNSFVIATNKPRDTEKIEVLVEYKYKNKTHNELIQLHKK
ncbi:DUF4944 domain-containing protein [Gottfriedia luciferensis]|uniref:DUF4944 domain-containing protein n=1 Tax=Gottfriedia luciferensis TaxID=178774 RepID=UPI000B450F90|nr:DUF4944 domain-containing protein [Gottfriedia luciferensis]